MLPAPALVAALRPFASRRKDEHEHEPSQERDQRGIALQTIIIIVVMLAIAGAVATVLFTRAGTETDRLEEETDRWTAITNETGCTIAGGVWSNPGSPGSCGPPGTTVHNASTPHDATTAHCHTGSEGNPAHTHMFVPGVDDDNNGDFTGPGDTPPSCT